MALSNCTKCGALFSRTDKAVCPKCIQEEEDKFQVAVNWVRDNPGRGINALSAETGIRKRLILKWVRENRMILNDGVDLLECKKCGKPISGGTFCKQCKMDVMQGLSDGVEAIQEEMTSESNPMEKGMHYRQSENGE